MLTENFRVLNQLVRQNVFESHFPDKSNIVLQSIHHYRLNYTTRLTVATSPHNQSLRNFFVTHLLENFFWICSIILPSLSENDLYSLGTISQTKKAEILIKLLHVLESYGFEGTQEICRLSGENSSIVFWSGQYAKVHVSQDKECISDTKVPAFQMLFALCFSILRTQQYYDNFCRIVANAFSKMFAASAIGVVKVFISSDKPSELPGLEMPNNFWEAELAQLQLSGRVTEILVYRYDHHNRMWITPINLKDPMTAYDQLVIRRRSFYSVHPFDNPIDREKFKSYPDYDRSAWQSSYVRPGINYASLKSFAGKWRTYKRT